MIRPGNASTAILLIAAAGCAGDRGAVAVGSPEAHDLSAPDRTISWSSVPVYTVGGFDAPDWATFGTVAGVGFDGGGRLYILDSQTSEITVVSPDGQLLASGGGAGDGPGELGMAMGMTATTDGRVVVSDLAKRALVVYDSVGGWIENVPVDVGEHGVPGRDFLATADGRIVAWETIGLGRQRRAEFRPVWVFPSRSGASPTKVFDAWNPPPPPEGGESTLRGGTGTNAVSLSVPRTQAFQPELHVAPLPDGRLAVVDSTDYRITIIDPAGGEVVALRRPAAPVPVTPELEELERRRRLDQIVARSGTLRSSDGGGVAFSPEAMRRMMEEQVENMSFYPEIPVVEALGADWEGRIWVQRSSGRPGVAGPTDILGMEGRYLGSLPSDGPRIPDAFGPNGLAAIVERDELDVATIRVVRFPTGNGSR